MAGSFVHPSDAQSTCYCPKNAAVCDVTTSGCTSAFDADTGALDATISFRSNSHTGDYVPFIMNFTNVTSMTGWLGFSGISSTALNNLKGVYFPDLTSLPWGRVIRSSIHSFSFARLITYVSTVLCMVMLCVHSVPGTHVLHTVGRTLVVRGETDESRHEDCGLSEHL